MGGIGDNEHDDDLLMLLLRWRGSGDDDDEAWEGIGDRGNAYS